LERAVSAPVERQEEEWVTGVSAEALLRLPVRLRGIELGHPVDVVLDPDGRRAIGLVVLCKDEAERFLPLTVAEMEDEEIAVTSSLSLLDEEELDFYRTHASTMRRLRGTTVRSAGKDVGRLEDVVVLRDGVVAEFVVANGKGRERLRIDDTVSLS
jgi:sporulation protein YlmC with PRC-barrel domain